MAEKILMKGNEAIAYGAIRCGADGYFGYPITPQSEVMETLMEQKPWETTGMVVLCVLLVIGIIIRWDATIEGIQRGFGFFGGK